MTSLKIAVSLAAGAALMIAAPTLAQTKPAAPAAAPAAKTTPAPSATLVEPEATAALDRMSTYLRTLQTFTVDTRTTLDLVTDLGQRIQIEGGASYMVRRPDGFVITVSTDLKKRTFYYDGKSFTIYAPELGYYASAAAPPTIAKTLDVVADKFGITLPLEDLFRWNDPGQRNTDPFEVAMHIGPATIDGVRTEQYAFRQGDLDWQIWIQTGDQPLPRKLVIVSRRELAQPAYSANLTWRLNPPMGANDFAFQPGKDAKLIRLSVIE